MIFIYQLYLLIVKLFLAGKDASSYLLKDKIASGSLTNNRIQRWHRDGVILDVLTTLPIAYLAGTKWWQIIISSVLLRLSTFDLAFNYWGGLDIHHLGSTAWADKQFAKIFGASGAVKKSLFFLTLLVLLNILKVILKT